MKLSILSLLLALSLTQLFAQKTKTIDTPTNTLLKSGGQLENAANLGDVWFPSPSFFQNMTITKGYPTFSLINSNTAVGAGGGIIFRDKTVTSGNENWKLATKRTYNNSQYSNSFLISKYDNTDGNSFEMLLFDGESNDITFNHSKTSTQDFGNVIFLNGKVGIGTDNFIGDRKLYVDGGIIAEKIEVKNSDSWADYVFEKDYHLRKLSDVASYIAANKHLPDVPSAKEVKKNGFDLAKMDETLLRKVEELTLYILQLEERLQKLEHK